MSRGQTSESTGVRHSVKPIAISVLIGMAVTALLLLLMSVVVAARGVPQSAVDPMAIFALAAGAFVAGYLCAKAMRANGLAYGGICGAVLVAVVLVSGMITGGNGLGVPALFKTVFIMLPAMIGGVVRVNTRRGGKIRR